MKKYKHAHQFWHLKKTIIHKEVNIGFCLERVEQYIPIPGGTLNIINMDPTERALEDV